MPYRFLQKTFSGPIVAGALVALAILPGCNGDNDSGGPSPSPTNTPTIQPTATTGGPTATPTRSATARPTATRTATPRPTAPNFAPFAGGYLASYQGATNEDGNVRLVIDTSGRLTATIVSPNEGMFTGTSNLTFVSPTQATFRIAVTSPALIAKTAGATRQTNFTFLGTLTLRNGIGTVTGTFTAGGVSGTLTGVEEPGTNPLAGTFSGTVGASGSFRLVINNSGFVSVTGTANGIPVSGTGFINPTNGQFTLTSRPPDGSVVAFSGRAALTAGRVTVSGNVLRNGIVIDTFTGSASAG